MAFCEDKNPSRALGELFFKFKATLSVEILVIGRRCLLPLRPPDPPSGDAGRISAGARRSLGLQTPHAGNGGLIGGSPGLRF